MGVIFAADFEVFSETPQGIRGTVRHQPCRSAPRVQLWVFPELQQHFGACLGRAVGHTAAPCGAAGSSAETLISSTKSGGTAVWCFSGRHAEGRLPGLVEVEKSVRRGRTHRLHFSHLGVHHRKYAKAHHTSQKQIQFFWSSIKLVPYSLFSPKEVLSDIHIPLSAHFHIRKFVSHLHWLNNLENSVSIKHHRCTWSMIFFVKIWSPSSSGLVAPKHGSYFLFYWFSKFFSAKKKCCQEEMSK